MPRQYLPKLRRPALNLDPKQLEGALAAGKKAGLNMVGIMAVGLFGQPANLPALSAFAEQHGLWLLDDAAQSFGASWNNTAIGQFGAVTATSFSLQNRLAVMGMAGQSLPQMIP